MKPNKISLGKYGEELACEFLKNKNYQILKRNYRTRFGEIDIIAKRDDILVFVEVKTKTGGEFGQPEEMVGKNKQIKLEKLAQAYLLEQGLSPETENFRIDIVSVMIKKDKIPEIKHLENAIQKDQN